MTTPKIILTDFDGTLTHHTEMTSEFFEILNLVNEKNLPFIIITGRSISWAHFFITHFSQLPIVISEGGGAISYKDKEGLIQNKFMLQESEIARLEQFCTLLQKTYPKLYLSSDSIGRVTDRAIELCDLEDEVFRKELCDFMDEHNINYSTSNVHLNFWCSDLSKANAAKVMLETFYPDMDMMKDAIYFGDNLNDQSMFDQVATSIGVSNIADVEDKLTVAPTVILRGDENKGPSGVLNYLKSIL